MAPIEKLEQAVKVAEENPNTSNIKQIQLALRAIRPKLGHKLYEIDEERKTHLSKNEDIPEELSQRQKEAEEDFKLFDKINESCFNSLNIHGLPNDPLATNNPSQPVSSSIFFAVSTFSLL